MDQSRPLRFVLGYNHGGFLLKEDREAFLVDMGFRSEGFGTHFHASANDPNDVSILSNTVLREEYESCFAPPGGVYRNELGSRRSGGSLHGTVQAEMSPVPTDANVLCLSGKTVGPFLTRHPAKIWRETGPSKEDHITEGLTISSKQNVGGDAMGKK